VAKVWKKVLYIRIALPFLAAKIQIFSDNCIMHHVFLFTLPGEAKTALSSQTVRKGVFSVCFRTIFTDNTEIEIVK
jgi:hypothetical protein